MLDVNDFEFNIIANNPDGKNINLDSGATNIDTLINKLKNGQLGAAFDGDADRLIMVDESGTTCNGDVLILLIAKYLSSTNQLKNDVVVSTVMSILDLKIRLKKTILKILKQLLETSMLQRLW